MSILEKVFIITFCRKIELFYGTRMIFDSIKIGFPDSIIVVIDNASVNEAKLRLAERCKDLGAEFVSVKNELKHWQIIQEICNRETRPFAILDPDMVFWDRCDVVDDALLSGRYIPNFYDLAFRCNTFERLHTSFWKVNDPHGLRDTIAKIHNEYPSWNPIQPQSMQTQRGWVRYDTGSVLYHSIKDKCHVFTENELDLYDHIFCGSHIDWISNNLGRWKDAFIETHKHVINGDIWKLKGIWRDQNVFFESQAISNIQEGLS